jgi:beta-lactamase regulating signal transducer with metallopeptidase domain/peroxiredoxin
MLVPLRLLIMPLITISLPLLPAATTLDSTDMPIESAPARAMAIGPMADMVPESALMTEESARVSLNAAELRAASNRVSPSIWTFLMAGWLAGVAFWSVRLVKSWCRIRRIAHNATQVSDHKVVAVGNGAAAMLGSRRVPRILVTDEKVSPFLFGVLRSVLVIPAPLAGNVHDEQLRAVFAHEFAHLRRRDPLIGWVLAVCEAVYFFHPVFHFVKRRILFERERACDDWVIATSQTRRSIYAHALINAADVCRSFSDRVGPVGAVAESFGDLKKRILAIGSNLKPRARLSTSALVLLLIIGAICMPGIVLTARSKGESEKTDVQVEAALIEGFRENRDKFTCGVLAWTQTVNDDGRMTGHAARYGGQYRLWWDGEKIATRYVRDEIIKQPGGSYRVEKAEGGMAYNGRALGKKPDFVPYENWLDQVIRWRGPASADTVILALKERENVALDWSTIDVDGARLIRLLARNVDETASDYGAYSVTYYDPSQGYGLVNEEFHDGKGRLYMKHTVRLREVVAGGWFPVEVDFKSISLNDGKVTLHQHFALDLQRCSFNDRSVIPEGIFESSVAEKQNERLTKILEKFSDVGPIDVQDESDRKKQGARQAVESFLAAALTGQYAEAQKFAHAKLGPEDIKDLRKIAEGQNLRIVAVYADSWSALAISTVIRADHGQIGPLVFHIVKVILDGNENWTIDDIDIQTTDKAEQNLAEFLKTHTDARIIPGKKTDVQVRVLTDRPPVALDLDSGELMRLDNGWPDEYDVAWDNDAGGSLFTRPDGPVKMLPIVEVNNFADALSIAVQRIESLKIRGVRGVFAEQCKYILISTSQNNIALVEVEEFDESKAKIRWQMIQQPIGKTGVRAGYEGSGSKLEFRIAPEVASTELSPEETDRYKKDLIENGPWAAKQGGDKFAWFEIKSGVTLSGPLIIEECGGNKYLLVYDNEPFVMLPEQGWGLQQVTVPKDQMGRPAIGLEFDQKGSELLYELTKANLRKALAITLNGKVVSAPTIQSAVRNNAIITGNFTDQEVQQMAEALRKGMPPATKGAPQKASEDGSSQGKVLDPDDFCTYALGVWNKPFNVLSQKPDDWWIASDLDFANKEDVWVKLSKLGFSTDADPQKVFEKAGRGDLCVPEPNVVLTLRGTVMVPLKVPNRKNATEQLFGRITRMKVGQVLEQIREYCSTQPAEQTRRFRVQPGAHYAVLRTDGLLVAMEIYEHSWAQFVPLGFISTQKTRVQAEVKKTGASLFEGIDIEFGTEQAKGKELLVCFWDMNQRPSRHLVTELAKRADKMQAKDIMALAVQTAEVKAEELKAWAQKYQIPFPCGVIKKDVDKVLYRWGARALPWLVLMDEKGAVRAEGFTLEHLDAVLEGKVSGQQITPDKGAGSDKVVLKLTDSDGWPVAGAQVGTNVDTRDVSTLGRKLSFSVRDGEHNISNDWGEIVLTREKLFLPSWPADVKTLLYVLHEDRNIGAVCEISRDDPRREIPLTLEPVCHVHGKLDSEGLKKVGRPLTWTNVYLSWNRDSFGVLSHMSEEQRFEFFVPPGKYELDAYGSGEGASTESVHPKIEVEAGQSELDLGIIDLPATKVSSLIGQPAPELGPIKAWKNSPPVKLADLRGKLVILHFGGGYPSTSRDLPKLMELHEDFKDAGLVILAIYNCESMEQLTKRFTENSEKFGGEPDVPFRLAVDGGKGRPIEGTDRTIPGATYATYEISSYPTTVLIGRQGEIIEELNLFRAKEKLESVLGVTVEPTLSGWRQTFYRIYRLEEGQVLKRITPPFIPERKEYYKQEHSSQAELIERPPDYFTFHWDGELKNWGLGFGSGDRPLSSVLNDNLSIDQDKFEGPEELLKIDVPGDWIVRKDISEDEKLKALEKLLADELGRNIRFVKRTVQREAIVAIGRFQFRPLPVAQGDRSVYMFCGDFDPDGGGGGGTADSVSEFLRALGNRVGMPVIDETESSQEMQIPYRHHRSAYLTGIEDPAEKSQKLRLLLDNLSLQTELRFSVEPRPVPIWFVTEDKAGRS